MRALLFFFQFSVLKLEHLLNKNNKKNGVTLKVIGSLPADRCLNRESSPRNRLVDEIVVWTSRKFVLQQTTHEIQKMWSQM